MQKYIYLLKINYFTTSNIYKFGIIEKNNIQEFMKSFTISYSVKDQIKKTNIVFHILHDIIDDTEIKIKNIFKEHFYLKTYLNDEYYEGDYKKMIDIIYSIIVTKAQINNLNTLLNHDLINLIKHDDLKIIEIPKMNYIYLLQEREFVASCKNIFKIGMSKTNNYKRFKQYPNNSILLFQMQCENATRAEKYIINIFKNMFKNKREIGREYFEGESIEMINTIYSILINENQPLPETVQKKITLFHIKKITYDELIHEYINSSQQIRENFIFKDVKDELKKLGIINEKKEILEKFMSIIKTKKGIIHHTNLIGLLTNENIFEFKNKMKNNNYNKILVIRKIEKDNNINKLDLDFNENTQVIMNDEFYEYILKLFKCKKKKPQTGRNLKILYVSMIRHLTPDIIKRKMVDKVINKQRKIITKYTLNKENIELSLELDKYSNNDRLNFNDIIKNL